MKAGSDKLEETSSGKGGLDLVGGLFSSDRSGKEMHSETTFAKPVPVMGAMDPSVNAPVVKKDEEKHQYKFGTVERTTSIIAYCVVSVTMTLYSKYIVTYFKFKTVFLLLGLQAIVAGTILFVLNLFGMVHYRKVNRRDVIRWFPVAMLLIAMRYTGTVGVDLLKVSTYTIFRNLTIILIAFGDRRFFGSTITPLMIMSFGLIIASSVMNGYSEPPKPEVKEIGAFMAFIGYFWAIVHCFAAAAYALAMRWSIRRVNFKDMDTTFYNNLLTAVPLLILSFIFDDWGTFMDRFITGEQVTLSSQLQLAFIILSSSVLGLGVGYTSAWCIRVVSSTTFSMVGSLNKLPVSVSGMLFWKSERDIPLLAWASIAMASAGGVAYSYAHWRLKLAKQKKNAETA